MDLEALKKTDPALYADMDFYLNNGEWRIEYESPTALWLRWDREWLHVAAEFDPDEARRLISGVPDHNAIVIRGYEGVAETAKELGFTGCNPCRQVVYEGSSPLPVSSELIIRQSDKKDFPAFLETYHYGDEDELREAFEGPDFLGGYWGEEFVGYIGVHNDGAMGMLHVFPPYRRRGYAEALYRTLINNQLKKGRTPFAQIIIDNEKSLRLQEKLGLRISDGLLYWMWRGK